MKKSIIMIALLAAVLLCSVSLGADVIRYVNHPSATVDNITYFSNLTTALSGLRVSYAYQIKLIPDYVNGVPIPTQFSIPWGISFNNNLIIESYLINGNSAKDYVYLVNNSIFATRASNQSTAMLDSTYIIFRNLNIINTSSYYIGIEFGERNGKVENCSFNNGNPFGLPSYPLWIGVAATHNFPAIQTENYRLHVTNSTVNNAQVGIASFEPQDKKETPRVFLPTDVYIDGATLDQVINGISVTDADTVDIRNSYLVAQDFSLPNQGIYLSEVNNALVTNTDAFYFETGVFADRVDMLEIHHSDFRVEKNGFYKYDSFASDLKYHGNTITIMDTSVQNAVAFDYNGGSLSFYQNTLVSDNTNTTMGLYLRNCSLNYYIHANIVWGMTTSVSATNVTNGKFDYNCWGSNPLDTLPTALVPTGTSHNIRVNPSFAPRQNSRCPYVLARGSQCINSGAPTPPNSHYAAFYDNMFTTIEMGARTYVPMNDYKSGDSIETTPGVLTSHGAYPNPFNPSTTIRYNSVKDGLVRIDIYNVRGQLVTNLVNKSISAGDHSVVWNGQDANGNRISSGIYTYRIQMGNDVAQGKLTLMK